MVAPVRRAMQLRTLVLTAALGCATEPSQSGDFAPTDPGDSSSGGKADGVAVDVPREHMKRHSGAPLANIKLWTITWTGSEELGQELADFHAWMLGSNYWARLGQYGVGAGTSMGLVVLPDPPPAVFDTDADPVTALLTNLFAAGTLPAPDADSAYLIIVPPSVDIEPPSARDSGYHSVTQNTPAVPYEVATVPMKADGSVDLDSLTYGLSHETAELATDPALDGWYSDDVWFGEVGDLCNYLWLRTGAVGPAHRSYMVSRLFSNYRAERGLDPCVPVASTRPYLGVATVPTSITIPLDANGNGTGTIMLTAFSSDPNTTSVTWRAFGVGASSSLSPDHGTLAVGTTTAITVAASQVTAPAPWGDAFAFLTSENGRDVADWTAEVHLATPAAPQTAIR
jgi:hypothetical protein